MDTRISAKTTVVVAIMAVVLAVLWAPAAAPAGDITEYPVPTSEFGSGYPFAITARPDGNLWFTESDGSKIGRITPAGRVTEYPVPTGGANPGVSRRGPDGNLWFTELGANKIGRITPAGFAGSQRPHTAGEHGQRLPHRP